MLPYRHILFIDTHSAEPPIPKSMLQAARRHKQVSASARYIADRHGLHNYKLNISLPRRVYAFVHRPRLPTGYTAFTCDYASILYVLTRWWRELYDGMCILYIHTPIY